MSAFRIYRRLRDLLDVDPNGLPHGGVPVLHTDVAGSSFVIETIAAGSGSFSLGASNLGNTLGQTGVTGTRVVLAGIGNITLSQLTDASGGTVSISGGTVAAGAAFSAGVSGGNTAGDTGATGSRVVLAGGSNVTLSQATDANGASITVNAASQTQQTQHLFDLTLTGNTAGVLAAVSSGTLSLAGGNNVTLSQAGNAITISAANQTVQPAQTGISSIAASDATYTSGQVQFTGSNMITVRSSAGQRVVIDATQSVQTQNVVDVTISGNTAGAGALVSSGTLTLAGGNNITVSQAGNAITISGPNAGGAQTGISGIANSETTYTSGTVSLSALGALTIRSTTGNQFQLSVNAQSVQPETQTFIGGISASDALYTSGTVRLTGVGGGVTVSSNTGQRVDISVAAPVAQTNQAGSLFAVGNTTSSSSGTYDARTLSLRGDGIISVAATNSGFRISASQSVQPGVQHLVVSNTTFSSGTVSLSGFGDVTVNTAANLIRISAPVQSVQPETQTFVGGLANSQTTYTSGTVTLSELGAITIRSTTGNQFQLSVNAQTVQTQNVVDVTLSGNTSGAMALISSGTMTLAGGNNITVSQAGNAVTISGPNVGGAQTGISGIVASDATYTSGTVEFTGSNMITVRSSAGQRVVIDATQSVQTQSLFSAGVSTGGNTAGDTGITGTRLVFVGSNNITLSQATAAAGGTITISGPTTAAQTNQTLGMYALGNTTGQSSSTTFDARTVSIRGDGIVSVGYSGGTLRISASQSVQPETQTFIAGISASDTLYTSGNVRFTGVGGGITVSSNTGQRVDLSVAAQSVQPGVQQFVVSNTTFSSGTVSISGFGDVTVNTAANIIRISAPTQTAQTGISGLANSQTTYTSGTVTLSELGAITIRSTTGNQYQFSVNSQTVQTQNLHNVTLSGNTAGVMAQISSGTMTLAGGANITLSQAGNAVTISGAAAVAGSDSDVTDINVVGHGFSVGDWLRMDGTDYVLAQADSEANAEVVGVVSAVDDADNFTLTTGGLVTGLTGLTAGVAHWLDPAVAGAITDTEPTGNGEIAKPVLIARSTTSGYVYNMRGNIINTAGMTAFLAGLSNVGNTVGDTGITGSRLVLAGGNNITLSQSTNASGGTVTISAFTQSVQPGVQQIVASNASFSSGTVSISGFGDVTVNTAAGIIRISAPVQTVESQSIGMSNLGNTSGTTGIASGGNVRFLFAGGNNITLSQSINGASGTITISAPNAIAETQTAISGISASDTLYTSGTVRFTGVGGGVTVSSNTGQRVDISVAAPVAQSVQPGIQHLVVSNTTFSSGTVSLSGFGDVTVNTAANIIRISAPVQSVQPETQTFIGGISASDTLYTSGSVRFTGVGGGVTVSSNTGQRVDISVAAPVAQSAESQSIGMSNIGNTSGTTGIASGPQVRMLFAGGNNITLSQSLNGASGTITISAFTQTVQTQNLHNVTLSGNTAGAMAHISSGTMTLAGGNGITLSQAGNAVTISGGAGGAAFSAGVSTGGNTAGSTGITGTRLVLVGNSNISLSQSTDANGGTVSINGDDAFSAGVSNLGNTAGATGVTGTRMVFVATNVMSLSQTTGAAGATITIDGPALSSLSGVSGISISTNGSTISIMADSAWKLRTSYQPFAFEQVVTGTQGQASLHLAPIRLPNLQFDRIAMGMNHSNASNSSGSFTISVWAGLYTQNASTLSMLSSISGSTNFSGSGTVGSYSLYGGMRIMTIPWNGTFTENDYWIGIVSRTTTGGAAGHTLQQLVRSDFTNATLSGWSGIMGAAATATAQQRLGLGVWSATTSGIPASVAFSHLTGSASQANREPIWYVRSGTV